MRQHALDRRAGRRRDRVRQGPPARLPAARGLRRRRRLPPPPHLRGREAALGRPAARHGGRAARVRAPGHRRHGLLVRTSSSCGTSSATPASTASGSGPGRGSAAGCAVAYCLRITDLDPIRYDLLFERFLNPSRVSMPDIDMDFDSRYRDEMIRYAAEKYGRDHVAQIVTFSTIKARAAVQDAARVLGYDFQTGLQDLEGDAAAHHGPRHAAAGLPREGGEARGRLQDGHRAAADVPRGPRRPAGDGRRQGPRGPAPPGRHPRRRGGDHPGQPHRVPADPAQAGAQPGSGDRPGRHPVRDGRRRGPRPPQDGLPRAAQPRRHHRRAADHRGVPRGRPRHRRDPARRREDPRPAQAGRLDGRVPARGRRRCGRSCARWRPTRSRTSPPSSPCTGPARWPRTCTPTTPTARTVASRSSTSTPTPRRCWPTPGACRSTRSRSCGWRRSSPATRWPRPTTCARRAARRSASSWRSSARSSSPAARPPATAPSSGRRCST